MIDVHAERQNTNTEGIALAKTTEQLKAEFTNLMAEHGFAPNGETLYDGREVYSRIWKKEVDVVWHGKMERASGSACLLSCSAGRNRSFAICLAC